MGYRRGITGGLLVVILFGSLIAFGAKPMMLALEGVMFGNYPIPSKATEMKGYIQEVCRGGEGDFKSFEAPPPYIQFQCDDCKTISGKAALRTALGVAAAASLGTEMVKAGKSIGKGFKGAYTSLKATGQAIKGVGVAKWSMQALKTVFSKVGGKFVRMKEGLLRFAKTKKLLIRGGQFRMSKQALKTGAWVDKGDGVKVFIQGDDLAKYLDFAAGKWQKTGNAQYLDEVLLASDDIVVETSQVTSKNIIKGTQDVTTSWYTAEAWKIGQLSKTEKVSRLKILRQSFKLGIGKKYLNGYLAVSAGSGYIAMLIGSAYPNLIYELGDATSEMQEDFEKIIASNATNVPVGIDRVIVVKDGTSAESQIKSIVESDQPQIRAAQGRQVHQKFVGDMHKLFVLLEDGGYAANHFTEKTATTPTYIVQVLQEGDSEFIVVRDEHAERLWDNVEIVVSYKLDEMARDHPEDGEKIEQLKADFLYSWTGVLGEAGLSHDPWRFVAAGLAEPASEMDEICRLEAGYDKDYICDWYFNVVGQAAVIEQHAAELQEINDDLLETQGKVLAALRSSDCGVKTVTVTETFPAPDFQMDDVSPETVTNKVELAECAVRLNCDYDTKALTLSEGCIVEALNLNEDGIKLGNRIIQLRGMPVQPLDYGQVYDHWGIKAATFSSGFISKGFSRGIGTLSAAIGNCGLLGNTGMVFCLKNAISTCDIPAMCAACYTVDCGVPISCNPAVSAAITAEHKGDRVEVLGAVKPF